MTTISLSRSCTKVGLAMHPNELIHSQSKMNEQLRPFLLRGRELSNPNPAYIPYFFSISEAAMNRLLKKLKTIRFLDQGQIEKQSNKANEFYIIFSGKVHLINNEEERSYLVRESFPNQAEFALLKAELISSSLISFEKTVFSVIKNSEFINWLLNCPDVSFGFLGKAPKYQLLDKSSKSEIKG